MMFNVTSCKHNQKKGTQTIRKKKWTRNANIKDTFFSCIYNKYINLKS